MLFFYFFFIFIVLCKKYLNFSDAMESFSSGKICGALKATPLLLPSYQLP